MIYGSTQARLDLLKSPTSALLNTNAQFTDKNGEHLLTYRNASNPQDPTKCMTDNSLPRNECWRSGDIRSNAVVALAVVHTLFHREHNRIVEKLSQLNPAWDQTRLFEEARKIVAATIAKITFDDYLPLILGPKNVQAMGSYRYDAGLNPSVVNEFGVAVMRFGHAAIPDTVAIR